MSFHIQFAYNKGLYMHRALNNEAPEYISNICTHRPSRFSSSRNCHFCAPKPRIASFLSWTSYPWQTKTLVHLEALTYDCFDRKLLERETQRERERERERDRDRDRDRQRQRQRDRENSNSKTLFYKDCRLGSVKNLTTNPC